MRKTIRRLIITCLTVILVTSCSRADFEIGKTTTNLNPVAVGVALTGPQFGWQMMSLQRNVKQQAYRIVVASGEANLQAGNYDVWDSGRKTSSKSVLVPYEGKELMPGEEYYWRVKAWDNYGNATEWSQTGRFITKLNGDPGWNKAKWIALDSLSLAERIVPGIHNPGGVKEWKHKDHGMHKLPVLRKEVAIQKKVKSVLAFICGLGQYEMFVNGRKVGKSFLAPGWTDYDDYVLYNTYDITSMLDKRANAIGVMLGNGFYNIPNVRYRKLLTAFGNPKMICLIKVKYEDGSEQVITSDNTWKVKAGPVTFSSIYGGETYNAALDPKDWKKAGFDDKDWNNATVVHAPGGKLRAEADYPVVLTDKISAKSIKKITTDKESWYLYDFGQNASGIVQLQVKGNSGDTVKIYPAELTDDDGNILQGATGKPYFFTYILKGDGVETWHPQFSYYGFRYAKILGAVPSTEKNEGSLPRVIELSMLHNRNSAPKTGQFHTSFQLFNRIYSLIDWAIRSNLMSVATDCPHREKLGWMEQTYLMGPGIHYNYDIYHLYQKLIQDMMFAQTDDGMVPAIAPEYVEFWGGFRDSPEWGSAAVILPYLLYKWYGDTDIVKKAWPMMKGYVEYLKSKSQDHIVDFGLGDWYDLGPETPGFAQLTPVALTATAIYYYDVKLMAEMAVQSGHPKEAERFRDWAGEIKTAFNSKFYDSENHTYATGSQTALSMPLVVGLVEEQNREGVLESLKKTIVQRDEKALTAGDVGFHFLIEALTEGGLDGLIFEMNARDDVPGYGYQLKKGATALTESWQALKRVSNNHLMLGHIMQWFYEGLGGIRQTDRSVGFKELFLAPSVLNEIDTVTCSFESPYGIVSSSWKKDGTSFFYDVEIPVNCEAVVTVPVLFSGVVTEDGVPVDKSGELNVVERDSDHVKIKVGSGAYHFRKK